MMMNGIGMPMTRPEPTQLKPGTISGRVRPPVSTRAMPEMMLIMPSVTISGFRRKRVVNSPLTTPMAAATTIASSTPIQIGKPMPCSIEMTTPVSPAIAATERSSPPAMISGVPAAAISPI